MTVERLRVGLQQLASDSAGYVSRAGERAGLAEGNQYVVSIHILYLGFRALAQVMVSQNKKAREQIGRCLYMISLCF
jgi:hypothetical protein